MWCNRATQRGPSSGQTGHTQLHLQLHRGKHDPVTLLLLSSLAGREGFFLSWWSNESPQHRVLQNERCAGCNAGSEDLTNRNGSGAPETSLTCSATSDHHSSVPSVPCPTIALPAHGTRANAGTTAASGDRQAAEGQPRPLSLPSQYPRLASRTQNPQDTFMPSLHSRHSILPTATIYCKLFVSAGPV